MFKFGKNAQNKNALRKLKLMDMGEWQCTCCNAVHSGLPDLATTYPDIAGVPKTPELNSALSLKENFLSEDFCVLNGEHFFIRTILKFQVNGLGKEFGFGVWSSLSRENFEHYIENFDQGLPEGEELSWFSWFMTSLNYFEETFKAKTSVIPQPNRQRPTVLFAEKSHRIYQMQRDGIEPVEMLKIYNHYGCQPA